MAEIDEKIRRARERRDEILARPGMRGVKLDDDIFYFPLLFRILVKITGLVETERKESRIITVSDEEKKRLEMGSTVGIVVGIGPLAYDLHDKLPCPLSLGDLVGFGRYAGKDFHTKDIEGNKLLLKIFNEDEVMLIIADNTTDMNQLLWNR